MTTSARKPYTPGTSPSGRPLYQPTPALPEVRKTAQMQEIETRYNGEDIRLVLKHLYEKLGTQTAVANELGLEQSVISIWAARLGIEFTNKPVAVLAADLESAR